MTDDDSPEAFLAQLQPSEAPTKALTNEGRPLVYSAHVGSNAEQFPGILDLYVPHGATVADVTWGQGVFWRFVPEGRVNLLATDLKTGVDCRSLPYPDGHVFAVVLDPPYMHTPGGTAHQGHQNYEDAYRNNATAAPEGTKYHEAVLALYLEAAREAYRVLQPKGVLIVKGQDEVCAGKQRLTHVEILQGLGDLFAVEDYLINVSVNRPGVSRMNRQLHARKCHSWWLVLRKRAPAKPSHR